MMKKTGANYYITAVAAVFVILTCLYVTRVIDSNFLIFTGSYCAFIGTAMVSFITLRQSQRYNEQEKARMEAERFHEIQPIFSVRVRTAAGFCTTFDVQKHSHHIHQAEPVAESDGTFEIVLKNSSYHPAKHVIIFGHYLRDVFSVNESASQFYAFADDTDRIPGEDNRDIHVIDRSEPKTAEGLPLRITVYYEDIDGHAMAQEFALKALEDIRFYSLNNTRLADDHEIKEIREC